MDLTECLIGLSRVRFDLAPRFRVSIGRYFALRLRPFVFRSSPIRLPLPLASVCSPISPPSKSFLVVCGSRRADHRISRVLFKMFEAKLTQAGLLKKVLEAMKDLVTETNFDCSSSGIALQAMDSSHVSLISLLLRSDGFDKFQCHRPLSLGLNLNSMSKVLRCAGNDDSLLLKAEEGSDTLHFTFESPKGDKFSNFELKLMDIQARLPLALSRQPAALDLTGRARRARLSAFPTPSTRPRSRCRRPSSSASAAT